jgi:hypothetical protein
VIIILTIFIILIYIKVTDITHICNICHLSSNTTGRSPIKFSLSSHHGHGHHGHGHHNDQTNPHNPMATNVCPISGRKMDD